MEINETVNTDIPLELLMLNSNKNLVYVKCPECGERAKYRYRSCNNRTCINWVKHTKTLEDEERKIRFKRYCKIQKNKNPNFHSAINCIKCGASLELTNKKCSFNCDECGYDSEK